MMRRHLLSKSFWIDVGWITVCQDVAVPTSHDVGIALILGTCFILHEHVLVRSTKRAIIIIIA